MEPFLWGVAVVAAVCLLQVPLTHLVGRYFEQDREGSADPTAGLPATAETYPRDPGTCPRCGLQNDDGPASGASGTSPARRSGGGFDYCANCLAPLTRLRE